MNASFAAAKLRACTETLRRGGSAAIVGRMRYAFIFGMLAALFGWWATALEGWGWLLLWPAADLALIAAAYARNRPGVFGKQPDGALPLPRRLFFLPFLVWQHTLWFLACRSSREHACDRVDNDLVIGRRLLPGETPPTVVNWVDLTAEFAEPAAVRQAVNYIALPILDAEAPAAAELEAALARLQPGPTYVHCAQGHGRTALFAIAWLAYQGQVKTVADGLALLVRARPGMRLSGTQARFLDAWLLARVQPGSPTLPSVPETPQLRTIRRLVILHAALLAAGSLLFSALASYLTDIYGEQSVPPLSVVGVWVSMRTWWLPTLCGGALLLWLDAQAYRRLLAKGMPRLASAWFWGGIMFILLLTVLAVRAIYQETGMT